MARTARIKKTGNGTVYYHLMSRTNDRKFLFDRGRVKEELVNAMKRAAAFSGIQICAYAAMDNHFHVVCKVVRSDVRLSEDALLGRMAMLKGAKAAAKLAERWKGMREAGMDCAVAREQDSLRRRMDDISEFMKTFKEIFNIWYKRERKYTGTIWSGRFKSTLIEGGRYRETCMRYVYLNPVRAGMVRHAADYAWCWMAAPDAAFAGSVPDERLLRRVAQIGSGKIFGSESFVRETMFALGDKFRSRHLAARAVEELGYATHGWRLAKTAA